MGNPEVSDLHLPVPADQQVAWLDIPVHQAGRMRGLQRSRGLREQVQGPRWAHRPLFQQLGQRRPVDQFHHQVRSDRRIGLVVVIDLRDARMRQRARVPCFGPEPGQLQPARTVPVAQQLHRHRPVQDKIRGPPDLTHPARSDTFVQPVPSPEQKPWRCLSTSHYYHNGCQYPVTSCK